MDRLNRKIGYIPNKSEGITKEVKIIISAPKNDNIGIKIAEWIKNAELINKSALCKEAKIDRANLDKYLQKGEIPQKSIDKVQKIIKKYGYVQ